MMIFAMNLFMYTTIHRQFLMTTMYLVWEHFCSHVKDSCKSFRSCTFVVIVQDVQVYKCDKQRENQSVLDIRSKQRDFCNFISFHFLFFFYVLGSHIHSYQKTHSYQHTNILTYQHTNAKPNRIQTHAVQNLLETMLDDCAFFGHYPEVRPQFCKFM